MHSPADTGQKASLSDYLAAERTLLAWIRTGLALMGFGFVVARFGLFLQQLQIMQHTPTQQSYGLSLWFGTALIAVGVIVDVLAGWQHLRLVRELDRGAASHSHSSTQAVLIAFFLALVGLAMAIYLVSIRSTTHSKFEVGKEITMALGTGTGIVDMRSNHSVDQTVNILERILEAKGVTLFALIDHSGEAEKVGMEMPPTKRLSVATSCWKPPVGSGEGSSDRRRPSSRRHFIPAVDGFAQILKCIIGMVGQPLPHTRRHTTQTSGFLAPRNCFRFRSRLETACWPRRSDGCRPSLSQAPAAYRAYRDVAGRSRDAGIS
jgi:putative membrane protein